MPPSTTMATLLATTSTTTTTTTPPKMIHVTTTPPRVVEKVTDRQVGVDDDVVVVDDDDDNDDDDVDDEERSSTKTKTECRSPSTPSNNQQSSNQSIQHRATTSTPSQIRNCVKPQRQQQQLREEDDSCPPTPTLATTVTPTTLTRDQHSDPRRNGGRRSLSFSNFTSPASSSRTSPTEDEETKKSLAAAVSSSSSPVISSSSSSSPISLILRPQHHHHHRQQQQEQQHQHPSILRRKYDPALDILRSWSSSGVVPGPMEAITKSQSADPDYDRGSIYRLGAVTNASSSSAAVGTSALAGGGGDGMIRELHSQHLIPRRNLTEAFEEMYDTANKKQLQNDPKLQQQDHDAHRHQRTSSSTASEDTRTTSALTIDTDHHHNLHPTIETASSSSKISGVTEDVASMISPTGVADELHHHRRFGVAGGLSPVHSPSTSMVADGNADIDAIDEEGALKQREAPEFKLHYSLQRLMSNELVQRVAFYSIIHDINKEASTMAANDDSGYSPTPDEGSDEQHDPIVLAVNGGTPSSNADSDDEKKTEESIFTSALIDEEQWLLAVIESRSPDETGSSSNAVCPPTFSQAIGEIEYEYENPITTLSSGSRTQLWKPSRSWWEAKSGKNPWMEPRFHNKRWRYLWPLIHYHKFLAKCIKKLKRNGVDVKVSLSPVSAFLREEVCAVSDHLAAVSLFGSEQWIDCLQHFFGWTESTKAAEEKSRKLVSQLKLRPVQEHGDIDSPLLRSQIDEQFLRALIYARAHLNASTTTNEGKRPQKESTRRRDSAHSNSKQMSSVSSTSQIRHSATKSRSRRSLHTTSTRAQQWQGYPHNGWWQPNWNPHAQFPFPDEQSSVHSALSSDSFSHGYMAGYHPHPAVGFHQHPYYPPMMYPPQQMMPGPMNGSYDASMYGSDLYNPQQMVGGGWSEMNMNHSTHQVDELPAFPSTPSRHQQDFSSDLGTSFQTPYKYDPNQQTNASPYWNHLQDHATLAMMGLTSPQATPAAPSTPHHHGIEGVSAGTDTKVANATTAAAQPLFLRQQYYGYSYGSQESYVPPSPASQFQMTPQSGHTYNYAYGAGAAGGGGFSPRRPVSLTKKMSANGPITEEDNDAARNDVSENTEPVAPARAHNHTTS